ncbi:hypothetical protein [Streptomyces sp. NPDC046909]|uniref:hypothetical protein n=1 Tax=Streptomyces sp. NPDC046909 TaxID=3155617 RepID=UPI0033F3BC5A
MPTRSPSRADEDVRADPVAGVAYGWVADDVQDLVGDNDTMRDIIASLGGASLTDAYLTRSLLTAALIGGGYVVQAALRPRGEVPALRAEPVLATSVSRLCWTASHRTVALVGSVLVLTAAGLGTGLTYALASHDPGQIPRLLGAALLYAPGPRRPRHRPLRPRGTRCECRLGGPRLLPGRQHPGRHHHPAELAPRPLPVPAPPPPPGPATRPPPHRQS